VIPPFDHELRTARLTLSALSEADAERIFEIQSSWNVARMLRLATFPPDLVAIRGWLAHHREEWREGKAFRFGVLLDRHLVGCADVDDIAEGGGDLGYWLDEAFWGRGIASEAAAAVLRFAVEKLGLERLHSGHADDNEASGKVLMKLGFRPVGEVTKYSRARGHDIVHRAYRLEVSDLASWQSRRSFC
jgi:RimJ/RimL family protein N-acetyltransferase